MEARPSRKRKPPARFDDEDSPPKQRKSIEPCERIPIPCSVAEKKRMSSAKEKERKALQQRKKLSVLKLNKPLYTKHLIKDRKRKKEAKIDGRIKKRGEMSDIEKVQDRLKTKKRVQRWRQKQKAMDMEKKLSDEAPQSGRPSNAKHLQPTAADTSSTLNVESIISTPRRPLQDIQNIIASGSTKSRQQSLGNKIRLRNKRAEEKKRSRLHLEISSLKRKLWKMKKSNWRMKKKIPTPELSPQSQTKRLLKGKFLPSNVSKAVREGCILRAQLRDSFQSLRSRADKDTVVKVLSGKIMRSERVLKSMSYNLAIKLKRQVKLLKAPKLKSAKTGTLVQNFFESKLASVICPRKRQGKKYDGVHRQKRYMTGNLRSLHSQFIATSSVHLSYRTFCRYKPKWVITPKLTGRDTCLCKTCENVKLLVASCKINGLLQETARELTDSLCCNPSRVECMLRDCVSCKGKSINFIANDINKPAMYRKWISSRDQVYSFKSKKFIDVTVSKKTCVYVTVEQLGKSLEEEFFIYMQHIGRVVNQTQAANKLIENLSNEEMAILIDWSQNYVCKYNREIQSVHFGASHKQIALHTGRLYTYKHAQSFCTISEITRHDPRAITAHLYPVLSKYLTLNPTVTVIYMLSDGPVTQYRNRDMYWLVTQHLAKVFPQLERIEWLFSEAGHGKGEADAVGATMKNTGDAAAAHGQDVESVESFNNVVTQKCPSIDVMCITLEKILEIDSLTIPITERIAGTLRIHHYKWKKDQPDQISFKSLTCSDCSKGSDSCSHFSMGPPWVFPSVEPPIEDLLEPEPEQVPPTNQQRKAKSKAKKKRPPAKQKPAAPTTHQKKKTSEASKKRPPTLKQKPAAPTENQRRTRSSSKAAEAPQIEQPPKQKLPAST